MASTLPTMTFPRPIFAALTPHPFLQAHLTADKSPIRANGRLAPDFRAPGVNTGSLTHCNGSAVVRLGNTSVVCGVRAEILKEGDISSTTDYLQQQQASQSPEEYDDRAEMEDLRLLVPNVELSTGSTPQHIPGNAPSTYAQTLITRIRSLLLNTRLLCAEDLRVVYDAPANPGAEDDDGETEAQLKGYWVLYLDIFFISIDGNAFDAAWFSILAALRDTLIPRAFWDPELEAVLCSDAPSEARRLQLRGLPVPSTFAVFEGRWDGEVEDEDDEEGRSWVLSDPDAFEESVCRETVCVVVDCSEGKKGTKDLIVRKIEKSGGGVVDRDMLKGLVKRAADRWGVVQKAVLENA
ncbi:hypothetical protein BS50DRAFT_576342 [Corynespora cassiicola Philippines]|uniref:Ribosomal RNA-processing protein 43 n=1 Tax=Corynespora cassiicola Philippines TaxID=1448308 RepID=A0A2T2NE71_CORCC|nr:hypothetical protein BS50DRAFT_576342 [Corynespora cassiicola Philippines]